MLTWNTRGRGNTTTAIPFPSKRIARGSSLTRVIANGGWVRKENSAVASLAKPNASRFVDMATITPVHSIGGFLGRKSSLDSEGCCAQHLEIVPHSRRERHLAPGEGPCVARPLKRLRFDTNWLLASRGLGPICQEACTRSGRLLLVLL